MTHTEPNPDHIMAIGTGFQGSKTLLSAVSLDLFSQLGDDALTGDEIGRRLGLHPRGIYDFLDALVSLRLLERDGDGANGRYRNSAETSTFLDKRNPAYIGGLLEMFDARLYRFWGDLTEGLKTGKPQNELKHHGESFFEEVYADSSRLEQFMRAMTGLSAAACRLLAERFDFSRYRTVCDVGGATGQLSMTIAARYPHLKCTSFDLPVVAPIAEKSIASAGLTDRIAVASGDFFADPLPRADVITMGHILHDWNLETKQRLIKAVYDALPDGGAFIAIEALIDDARRENTFGLMMSLNMLIEFGDAFDYTGADFAGWCRDVGFRATEVMPLTGSNSAAIAYK
jgi:hypothetical protein